MNLSYRYLCISRDNSTFLCTFSDELAELSCRLWFDSDLLEVLLEWPESLLDSSLLFLSSLEPELDEIGVKRLRLFAASVEPDDLRRLGCYFLTCSSGVLLLATFASSLSWTIMISTEFAMVESFGRKSRNYDFNEREETIWHEAIFENEENLYGIEALASFSIWMNWFGCESQENTLLYLIEVCEVKSMLKIFRIERRNKCFEPKCTFLSKNNIFSVGSRDVTSISSRSLRKNLGP